jgi:hypothetical protein
MRNQAVEKTCFVLAPTGPADSEPRQHADRVFKFIISAVLDNAGYTTVRPPAGAVIAGVSAPLDPEILTHLVEDPLVIVDLTYPSPDVFYQLAVRHMVHKPTVHLLRRATPLPTALPEVQAIEYTLDLEGVERSQRQLADVIYTLEQDPGFLPNPIASNVTLDALRRSEDPILQSNATIMAMLRRLNDKVDMLTQDISHPQRDLTGFAELWVNLQSITDVLAFVDDLPPDATQIRRALQLLTRVQRVMAEILDDLVTPPAVGQAQALTRDPISDPADALGQALANLYRVTAESPGQPEQADE